MKMEAKIRFQDNSDKPSIESCLQPKQIIAPPKLSTIKMTALSEEKKTENHVDISETRRTSSQSAASLANLRIAESLIPVLEEGIKRPRSRLRTESSEVKKAKQSDEGEREPLGCVTNSPAKITSKRARSRAGGAEEEP